MAAKFQLVSQYAPAGDQPKAIEQLVDGFAAGKTVQVLLGATGTGKTFTAAQRHRRSSASRRSSSPTTRRSRPSSTRSSRASSRTTPSTTSSATTTTTSPKRTSRSATSTSRKTRSINENIDRLRLAATVALVSREDVIIVASVSCIYGLGSPSDYKRMMVYLTKGEVDRPRQPAAASSSTSSTSATTSPSSAARSASAATPSRSGPRPRNSAYRIELFGDEVDALAVINPITGETIKPLDELYIYPAKHFVTPGGAHPRGRSRASSEELNDAAGAVQDRGQAARSAAADGPHAATTSTCCCEVGYCSGIENYARWFSGRKPGEPPYTLIDFFPEDFLLVVDESHVTLPQVRGMYAGDRSRKDDARRARLPPAERAGQPAAASSTSSRSGSSRCLFMSATPGAVRAGEDRRRGRRAGDPADGAGRSGDPRQAGPRAGAGPG